MREEGSPYINHFIQPDSLIPNPSNPQAWNRYSYVGNKPIRNNDPTGHCENLLDCLTPDAWVLSLNLIFSFPGPEYQKTIRETTDPTDVINPYTYSKDFEVMSLDLVWLTGEEDQKEIFTTSSSSHSDNHFAETDRENEPGFVTPQISLAVEGAILRGDKFQEEGVNAYGGDADNVSLTAGAGTIGSVFTNSWGGIVGGINTGFPPASLQTYHSISNRNPSQQKTYTNNKPKLLGDFFKEFGSKVATHYGWDW